MPGRVYLVGAGPGDPDLLTLKGKRVLGKADVVVYDRLANPALLDHCRPDAERIYAGKGPGRHALSQAAIHAVMVRRAAEGRTVVRLKGGDPFLFGRGGEEAEALTAAGIPWEYVPGVTSALAAPGYAGVPVTHRRHSASLAIVTGHADPASGSAAPDWRALAGVDTLIVMMGAASLPEIAAALASAGRSPKTPVLVVSRGTWPTQTCVSGTLEDIVVRCREVSSSLEALAPAVAVVGEVALLRERLRWWDRGPLFGRRIALTRPEAQSRPLRDALAARGAEVILCPAIRTRPLPDADLSPLEPPADWIVFTSANGVEALHGLLRARGQDLRRLGPGRIAVVGSGTARAVEELGLHVDFMPGRNVAEGLVEEFPEPVRGRRILLPRAREARDVLPSAWTASGADVAVMPVYETTPDDAGCERLVSALAEGPVHAIVFTASSTVRSVLRIAQPELLRGARIVCIGPITAAAAEAGGLQVDAVSTDQSDRGIVSTLERLLQSR